MQNAMCLVSIFGPLLMILGLWMLFYYENMAKLCTSVKNDPSALCILGCINVLLGLTILTQYNGWDWSLFRLMTLLGWCYVIRGVMMFFLPQMYFKCAHGNPNWVRVKGIIPLVWGFGSTWLGYWS